MQWSDLFVAGVGAHLPDGVETAQDAVLEGRYDEFECRANGVREVRVAGPDETGPVMAASAGRRAWDAAGQPDCGIVVHAGLGHQGQDFWTPASYVQREVVGGHGLAVEIRQGSNGGLAAFELAATYLLARPDAETALITTGDAFHLPYVDRWSSDDQQVYGDGAGAMVLSTTGGIARVVASYSYSDPELEPIHRGTAGGNTTPFLEGEPVDLRARKRQYLLQRPERYDETLAKMAVGLDVVVEGALGDAGLRLDEVDHVVHATLAETIVDYSYYRRLGIDRTLTTYDWGLDFGHIGAGDELIGLDHLLSSSRCAPGDTVLAIGAGIGYCWSAVVLRVGDLTRTNRTGVTRASHSSSVS